MAALDLLSTPPHGLAHVYPALSAQPGVHTAPQTCSPEHTASLVVVHAVVAPCEQFVQVVHADTPVVSALKKPAAHTVHTADVLAANTLP